MSPLIMKQLSHFYSTPPSPTPNINRVLVEHQAISLEVGRPEVLSGSLQTTGVPKVQRKYNGNKQAKRRKELRVRPRSSVAPVSSLSLTKTRYRAERVSRLPYPCLPIGS